MFIIQNNSNRRSSLKSFNIFLRYNISKQRFVLVGSNPAVEKIQEGKLVSIKPSSLISSFSDLQKEHSQS